MAETEKKAAPSDTEPRKDTCPCPPPCEAPPLVAQELKERVLEAQEAELEAIEGAEQAIKACEKDDSRSFRLRKSGALKKMREQREAKGT